MYIHLSVFSFPDDNLSKYEWIFTKLGMCIDIVEIWFGIANGQILISVRHTTVAGYYHFMVLFLRVFSREHYKTLYFIRVICLADETCEMSSLMLSEKKIGPVVQSIISWTSSLVVKNVNCSNKYNIYLNHSYFSWKNVSSFCKCTFLSVKILAYMPYLLIKVLTIC